MAEDPSKSFLDFKFEGKNTKVRWNNSLEVFWSLGECDNLRWTGGKSIRKKRRG